MREGMKQPNFIGNKNIGWTNNQLLNNIVAKLVLSRCIDG
jgi:hypothetical protein